VAIGSVVLTTEDVDFVVEADKLGAHSVWVPEAWGQDALTPLAYLAARTTSIRLGSGIVQVGARTPANLAMAAASLQTLSGGRFLLGLGTSGPQVMEGWHGVRFTSPLAATRETIDITAGSTTCRCPAGRAGRSGRCCRSRRPSPFTSPPSARRTWR
jgi:alkanesulfonate monooxygenase SsuD/methylene tetrahydromethanopterin reductase-like flavin-dependent oxidoreductase (luciferase family)